MKQKFGGESVIKIEVVNYRTGSICVLLLHIYMLYIHMCRDKNRADNSRISINRVDWETQSRQTTIMTINHTVSQRNSFTSITFLSYLWILESKVTSIKRQKCRDCEKRELIQSRLPIFQVVGSFPPFLHNFNFFLICLFPIV